jgi:hypothetical protein
VSFPISVIGQVFGKLSKMRVALHGHLRGFENSSAHPIPTRLLRSNRPVDNSFRFFHQLYHRCSKEDVAGDRLIASRIRYSNPSVNWSKYAKPWDVIFDFPGRGIAQFLVCGLPRELPKTSEVEEAKAHSFFPGHVPECCNYSHCEIRTFKEGSKYSSLNCRKPSRRSFVKL